MHISENNHRRMKHRVEKQYLIEYLPRPRAATSVATRIELFLFLNSVKYKNTWLLRYRRVSTAQFTREITNMTYRNMFTSKNKVSLML